MTASVLQRRQIRVTWNCLPLLWVILLLSGCGKGPSSPPPDGKALAEVACAQCHTVPSPSDMAAEEWPYLLAWMGSYLGHPAEIELHPGIVIPSLVPPGQTFTRRQFDAIKDYYLEQAAVQFHPPPPTPAPPVSTLFEVVPFPLDARVISMVDFDPQTEALLVGTSQPAGLFVLQRGSTIRIDVPSEPVGFERLGNICRISLIGDLGTDFRRGQVTDFAMADGTRNVIVTSHPRIAAHRTADVDADGTDDLLVCGFGDYPAGRVGIWWGDHGRFTEKILLEESGAVWGDVADLDGDGDLDIVLMIANNRPRIMAFVNDGNRRLTPRHLVERPVGWGFNRGAVVDWNGDGKPDLVEVSGNKLELRGRPIKAHHGVRVLQNDGNWVFREVLFEPLQGAIDVIADDFNGDGRVDLAATAFFPDWRLPTPTTFLLLLQRADGTAERAGIDDQFWNRWMRVASGDADGDGDIDILLGAAEVPMAIPPQHMVRYQTLLANKASLLLLRNQSRTEAVH